MKDWSTTLEIETIARQIDSEIRKVKSSVCDDITSSHYKFLTNHQFKSRMQNSNPQTELSLRIKYTYTKNDTRNRSGLEKGRGAKEGDFSCSVTH